MDKRYIEAIKVVASEVFGEIKITTDSELRFGTKYSKAVNLTNATWFDFEANEGGGLIDLIQKHKSLSGRELSDYLYNEFGIGERNIDTKATKPPPQGSKIVNEYNYVNENGEVTYQVLRFEPKTFKQRHFKDGKTVWGLKDIEPLPYNLPKILEDKDKTIFIVEGEKDADRMMSLGFLATTNSGGSKNWKPSLNKYFKDRRVILISDNDSAGYLHTQAISNHLLSEAESLHFLSLEGKVADKGDISDFIDAGGDIEELILNATLVENLSQDVVENVFPTMGINDLMGLKSQTYLIENLIPEGGLSVIYGQPASFKSFVAIDMCLSISSSIDWQGYDTGAGKTLFIAAEGVGGLKKRIQAWLAKNKDITKTPDFHVLATTVDFLDPEQLDKLINTIHNIGKDFKLIVIDTIARTLSNSGSDENSASDMGMFLSACDTVREQTKSAILAIHHSGKNEASGLRGSSALLGGVDTSINCSHSGTVNLSVQKQKDTEQLEMISLEIEKRHLFADTSVTLQKVDFESSNKPTYDPALGANQKLVYDIIKNSLEENGEVKWINSDVGEQTFLTLNHISFKCFAQFPDKEDRRKKQKLDRALLGLQNKNVVGVWNEKIWLIK